jgi:Na+/H+ antiporter subunit
MLPGLAISRLRGGVPGFFIMTVGVYGAIRMPDTYAKLHSMSEALFLGVVALCASSAVAGDPRIMDRSCEEVLMEGTIIVGLLCVAWAVVYGARRPRPAVVPARSRRSIR